MDYKLDVEEMKRRVAEIRALPKTTFVASESAGPIDSSIPGVEFVTSPYVPDGTIYVFSGPAIFPLPFPVKIMDVTS